jgi:nitroimidazol reductase NimA-like FMN-containing flavoprotein (pyridoxamine 5'-phosphate oxidase superfamily)
MPGYGIQDAQAGDGLLPWSFVSERMAAARNYWVHTTRPDGRPHAAPVWGLWHAERFYFGTGPDSRKGRNLAASPHVVVHLESGDEVVIFEGRVELVEDKALLAALDKAYKEKYGFPLSGGFRLAPETAFAWREHDFPTSATRWQFGETE